MKAPLPVEFTGTVVAGDSRGRRIGFPTANVDVGAELECLHVGVYAAMVQVGNEQYAAVVNIGVRPTFGGTEKRLEAHLLNFAGDLYGMQATVRMTHYLREEIKFGDAEELVRQIETDIDAARRCYTREQDSQSQ